MNVNSRDVDSRDVDVMDADSRDVAGMDVDSGDVDSRDGAVMDGEYFQRIVGVTTAEAREKLLKDLFLQYYRQYCADMSATPQKLRMLRRGMRFWNYLKNHKSQNFVIWAFHCGVEYGIIKDAMKLKTTVEEKTGGAVIADRFKLDVPEEPKKGPAGVNMIATIIAVVGALLAAAAIGGAAAMMYVNWGELSVA